MSNTREYDVLKKYVRSLVNDDVKYVYVRLHHKFSGDLAEVLDFLSETPEMDDWLKEKLGADELYDSLDELYNELEDRMKQVGIYEQVMSEI